MEEDLYQRNISEILNIVEALTASNSAEQKADTF
jgi:hypothetical protein